MQKARSPPPPTNPANARGGARRAAPVLPRGTSVRSFVHVGLSVRAASRVVSAKVAAAAVGVRA